MPSPTTRTARSTIRSWIRRLNRHTLEVFDPGAPYRPRTDRA